MPKSANILSYTIEEAAEMAARGCDRTDWARVDALTQDEIEASIDVEDEGLPDFSNVYVSVCLQPSNNSPSDSIRISSPGSKPSGPGYQTRMNAVLRSYMLAKAK